MTERVQILKDWIEREGRKQNWVAQQIGVSPQWLTYVLTGKKPLSERLACALEHTLGVPLRTDPTQAARKPGRARANHT